MIRDLYRNHECQENDTAEPPKILATGEVYWGAVGGGANLAGTLGPISGNQPSSIVFVDLARLSLLPLDSVFVSLLEPKDR